MKRAEFGFLAACVLIAGCGHGGPPGGMMQGGFAFPVAAAPLTKGTIVQTFSVTGTVDPLLSASLSSVASGTVLTVGAQIGEHVTKGELLVQIDPSTLEAQLQSSQAALAAAQAKLQQTVADSNGSAASTNSGLRSAVVSYQTAELTLQRDVVLLRKGYVAQSDVDAARQQAEVAQAQLSAAQVAQQNAALNPGSTSSALANIRNEQAAVQQAQADVAVTNAQLAQTSVRAPFDGVVTARDVDPGSLAAPGTVLMQVDQLDPIYVDTGISGASIAYVHLGTSATVTISTIPGRSWHGAVKYLNLAAAPGSLTYLARIPIANADQTLRGGMVASVAFEQARKSGAILAPRAAVFETDEGYSMFIAVPGPKCPPKALCAAEIPVDVGLQNDQMMEVSGEGLKPGVEAILNHAVTLQPGMPVMIPPPPASNRPTK
jgi:HlyD family secretion protein